ncbi:MAG: heat-shock protein Hsp70, partial [Gammaproteobacteria bacterium]|nr:heat-shock protein Hsp70 [Gammaproteobacteria bacterium]
MSPASLAEWATAGQWRRAKHLALLNDKLLDIHLGRLKRLLVTMPPRHGKSECISRFFPAWYIGRDPSRKVILASYEHNFAASWGAKARDVLAEFGPAVFGVRLRADRGARDDWQIDGHEGGMVCA